eukprot:8974072-Pyramimonas_sp.AAC.1
MADSSMHSAIVLPFCCKASCLFPAFLMKPSMSSAATRLNRGAPRSRRGGRGARTAMGAPIFKSPKHTKLCD